MIIYFIHDLFSRNNSISFVNDAGNLHFKLDQTAFTSYPHRELSDEDIGSLIHFLRSDLDSRKENKEQK